MIEFTTYSGLQDLCFNPNQNSGIHTKLPEGRLCAFAHKEHIQPFLLQSKGFGDGVRC